MSRCHQISATGLPGRRLVGTFAGGAPMARLAGARTLLALVVTITVADLLAGCGEPDVGSTGSWSTHAVLSLGPRQEMGVAAVGGQVYVVGGFDGAGQALATVESYDPATDRWSRRASLPAPLHHVNLASVAGKLYVVGALSGGSFDATGTTLVYDPALDTWTPLASMPAGAERGASGGAGPAGRPVGAGGRRGGAGAGAPLFRPRATRRGPPPPPRP